MNDANNTSISRSCNGIVNILTALKLHIGQLYKQFNQWLDNPLRTNDAEHMIDVSFEFRYNTLMITGYHCDI